MIKYLLFLLTFNVFASTYISGPALHEGYENITSSGGTTSLTKDSETNQIVLGTLAHIVKLPNSTTLKLGRRFDIINNSSLDITVDLFDGTDLTTVTAGSSKTVYNSGIGTSNGFWDVKNAGGGGSSFTGTEGSVLFASADGNIAENNDNLFWNNSSSIFIIGNTVSTDGSAATLHLQNSTKNADVMIVGPNQTPSGVYAPGSLFIGNNSTSGNTLFYNQDSNSDFVFLNGGTTNGNKLATLSASDRALQLWTGGANFTGLRSYPTPANSVTYILPSDDGSSGDSLHTDGASNLYWTTSGGGSGWNLTGNAGTVPSTDYSGTSDAQPYILRSNAEMRLALGVSGDITFNPSSVPDPEAALGFGYVLNRAAGFPNIAGLGPQPINAFLLPEADDQGFVSNTVGVQFNAGTGEGSFATMKVYGPDCSGGPNQIFTGICPTSARDGVASVFLGPDLVNAPSSFSEIGFRGDLKINYFAGITATNNTLITISSSAGTTFSGDVSLSNEHSLKLYESEANGTNFIGFKAPSDVSADVTFVLPSTDGTYGQVLFTNGGSVLSWTDQGTTGTGGSLTGPTGAVPDVVYSDQSTNPSSTGSGSLGTVSGLTASFDSTAGVIFVSVTGFDENAYIQYSGAGTGIYSLKVDNTSLGGGTLDAGQIPIAIGPVPLAVSAGTHTVEIQMATSGTGTVSINNARVVIYQK